MRNIDDILRKQRELNRGYVGNTTMSIKRKYTGVVCNFFHRRKSFLNHPALFYSVRWRGFVEMR